MKNTTPKENINLPEASEAKASILLQMGGMATPFLHEWFEARRMLGIKSYSDENLLEVLKARLGK